MTAKKRTIIRDCTHNPQRPHGTMHNYKEHRCRCPECRAENTQTARVYRGHCDAPLNRMDAAPVRKHIKKLRAAGVTYMQISAQSGVALSIVRRLWPGTSGKVAKHVTRMNYDAILGVTADDAQRRLPPQTPLIPVAGARRRIEALMCLGWSVAEIARRANFKLPNLSKILRNEKDYLKLPTHQRIVRVYDELWDKRPALNTGQARRVAHRTMAIARERGYAPPLAWDDDQIDDPKARPQHKATRKNPPVDEIAVELGKPTTIAERRTVIEQRTDQGLSAEQIAQMIDAAKRTVTRARALSRAEQQEAA